MQTLKVIFILGLLATSVLVVGRLDTWSSRHLPWSEKHLIQMRNNDSVVYLTQVTLNKNRTSKAD